MVKNPPPNARDVGLIPDWATKPIILSATTTEPEHGRAQVLQLEKARCAQQSARTPQRAQCSQNTCVCVCAYAPKYAQLKKLSPRLQRYVTTETGCYSQGNYYTWAPKVLEQSLSYHIPEKKLFTNVSSYLASPLFGASNLIKCCWEDCCYLVPKSDSSETPWTVVQKAPLSMGFPRQEYWSGFAGKIYPVKKTK